MVFSRSLFGTTLNLRAPWRHPAGEYADLAPTVKTKGGAELLRAA
jgi:hypothetical protein